MVHFRRFLLRRFLLIGLGAVSPVWNCGSGGPVDLTSEPVPLGTIIGTVSDDDGLRPGVTVTLSRGGAAVVTTLTSQEGNYEFRDIDPGLYTISISGISDWGCATHRIATVSADVGTTANFLCPTPLPRGRVAGTVTVNGFSGSDLVVALRSGAGVRTTTTGRDGNYFFGGVEAGSQSVSVESPHLRCEAATVALSADRGARADISCSGQVVTGKLIVNGSSISGSTVALCAGPVRDEGGCIRLMKPTGMEGRFAYTDLAPGLYYAFLQFYNHGPGVVCPEPDPVPVDEGTTVVLDLVCVDENPWDY